MSREEMSYMGGGTVRGELSGGESPGGKCPGGKCPTPVTVTRTPCTNVQTSNTDNPLIIALAAMYVTLAKTSLNID